MKNSVNIILANALVKNGNRGCVALSFASMAIIDEILNEAKIGHVFYLPDSLFFDEKEHAINLNGMHLKFFDCRYPIGLTMKDNLKIYVNVFLGKKNHAKKIFKDADYILDIGQGDSFADIYGEYRFKSIDLIHKIARKYNKPYCLLPQTIGPFEDESIRESAIESITTATMVMARDKQSYDFVKQNAPSQSHAGEYIDVAFFLPYAKKKHDDGFVHIGLNVSALLWHGGYTKNNQFALTVDYPVLVRGIIEYFLSLDKVKLHLIPHVVSSERHIENDYAVSYDLYEEYANPQLVLAPLFLDPVMAKSYIAGLDFFMGTRMHATIAAFSSGVPVVPMAYSRKFNGLFVDTLDYADMVDLKTQGCADIIETIKHCYEQRAQLKDCIEKRLDGVVRERKTQLYNDLKKFFGL